MPRPVPIASELRQHIGDDIALHVTGCNELAHRYRVSAGMVSKIARERGLSHGNDWKITTATECHRVGAEPKRFEGGG